MMPDVQASRNNGAPRAAIWITCRECGHTSRVLSVMASRVLQERDNCPECLCTELPRLNQTPIGTGIVLSEMQRSALRETDDARLHTWIAGAPKEHWYDWLQQAATSRLANRFSKGRRYVHDVPPGVLAGDATLVMSASAMSASVMSASAMSASAMSASKGD